jgi:hypothetical protein
MLAHSGGQHFQGGVNRPAVHLALNCKRKIDMRIDMDGVNMLLFYYKVNGFFKFHKA